MRSILLLVVLSLTIGCKTAELAVVHPTSGINLVARFESKDSPAVIATKVVPVRPPAASQAVLATAE